MRSDAVEAQMMLTQEAYFCWYLSATVTLVDQSMTNISHAVGKLLRIRMILCSL